DLSVDNSPEAVPAEVLGSHAWSDATQTDWNGILGEFYIEALPAVRIEQVQVYPDLARRQARVAMTIVAERAVRARLTLSGAAWNTPCEHELQATTQELRLARGENRVERIVDMGDGVLPWSEFHPTLYRLEIGLKSRDGEDVRQVDFGMRDFRTEGRRFLLNGRRIFLRGKHDACVFPLTGYAPMEVDAWREVFRTAKRYGINHYRCHSYAPPRAAFVAADIEGIYLLPELPRWGSVERGNDTLNAVLLREAQLLFDAEGNHPSFMLFGLGNELGGDTELMREWLDAFRRHDDRRLYCFGANNFLGWKGPQEGEACFITCRVGGGDDTATHVRTSFAFVDAEQGGMLNRLRPSTDRDYSEAVARAPLPVVGHETGQFQSYPDYGQIDRYTGILRPCNLETFRRRLAERGMADQAEAFSRATERFALECYKADIEQALRTPGMGGFQLLDLQDYPGQGTAAVGLLDAFMRRKKGVDAERLRGCCAPVVPLARFADHCLRNDSTLHADLLVANYSEHAWRAPLTWRLATADGTWERRGTLAADVAQGEVGRCGSIDVALDGIRRAAELTLTLTSDTCRNSYRLWVYPRHGQTDLPTADRLDEALRRRLEAGGSVLLVPRHDTVEQQSVGGLFTPDFWNYSMFKTISERAGKEVSPGTLSLLVDPAHPLFGEFPTGTSSDWQWWSIARNSRPMILDALPCRPIVQVVDNAERCHRLGLLFEFRVGAGRLLVCMCDLDAVAGTPEGDQWRHALSTYLRSAEFAPAQALSWEELCELFGTAAAEEGIRGVENASDYTQGGGR
ncbi:MAG: glycoside hydrolase, partial [Alistipes sp.]|nr:glycoside hydrolase [Alistipes sp.]